MRTMILSAACSYGHQESNGEVKKLLLNYLNK